MTFNTDWDINKYKSEFEADDHWNIRKDFLLAHKERIPEEKLVCLAQVFYNIEFLGCRYPEKTMKLVEEMSREVAAEHRDIKKGKLQRTFVKASDAATARIQGTKTYRTDDLDSQGSPKTVASNDRCRNPSLARNNPGLDSAAPILSGQDHQDCKLTLAKIQSIQGPCGSMVVLRERNDWWTSLLRNGVTWKMQDRMRTHEKILKITAEDKIIWRVTVTFCDIIGIADSEDRSHAKAGACHLVIWKLQQYYYSIELYEGFNTKAIARREPDVQEGEKGADEPTGGSGEEEQGIEEPVDQKGKVVKGRRVREIRKLINDYRRREDDFSDLVFVPNRYTFKTVRKIARGMDMKTKFVGKNKLIVSKKTQLQTSPWVFIENFLKLGETEFENCKLVPPKTMELTEMEGVTYQMGIV